MAKVSGIGQNLYVDGYNLTGDIGSVDSVEATRDALDVTDIGDSSHERIYGRRDGMISFMSYFNPTAGRSHPVLSAMPTSNVLVASTFGTTLGDPAACMVAKQVSYSATRAANGALTFVTEAQAADYGVEFGRLHTAGVVTHSGATDETGYEYSGQESTSFGLQAYLFVFSLTGDDITVTLEESSDDDMGDSYTAVTGGGFAEVTSAPAVERIETGRALTVEQFLRVSSSGTFTSADLAVVVCRNLTTVST